MSIPLSGGLRYSGLVVGGVAREELRVGVDVDRGLVDGRGRLTEADADEPHLAVVFGDVACGEHPGDVGAHRRVDDEVPVVVQLDSPLTKGAEVRRESQG